MSARTNPHSPDHTGSADSGQGATALQRGRPRSVESERAILAATLDLLAQGQAPATISINAIARLAGTGKDTIYRRWPCKEDLLLAALASQQRDPEIPEDASVREGLIAQLAELIERFQNERNRRIMHSLQGAGADFPKLNQRYHEQVVEPRRNRVRALIRAGIERGELRSEGDPAAAALMPFSYVIENAREGTPIEGSPRRAAELMVDAILDGIATPR